MEVKDLDDRDLEVNSGRSLTEEEEQLHTLLEDDTSAFQVGEYTLVLTHATTRQGEKLTIVGGNDGGSTLDNYKFSGWVTARAVVKELLQSLAEVED